MVIDLNFTKFPVSLFLIALLKIIKNPRKERIPNGDFEL